MGLFDSLFGQKPQMGGDTAGLEGNFDKAFKPQDEGLNIDPKLALLSQIFANMQGKDSPVFQYSLAMQQHRQRQLRDQQQRMQGREDKQWEWANEPKKSASDDFLRALEAAGIAPGTPEYTGMARKRAQMLTNPVQLVPDGMGGMTPIRPQEMGGDAPDILDPETVRRLMGGGAGNGTGGFP